MTFVLGAIAVVLVVAGAAGIVLERQVIARAHRRTVAALESAVGGRVEVVLHGRPLALHLWRRELPAVDLEAVDVPVPGHDVVLDRITVHLEGVHLPRGARRGAAAAPLRADHGHYEAHLSEDDLVALVELPPGLRIVRLAEPRGLRIAATVPGIRVDATLEPRGDHLVVRPEPRILQYVPGGELLRAQFVVPLPGLPAGARIESLTVTGRTLVVRGPLDGTRLAPPPAEIEV